MSIKQPKLPIIIFAIVASLLMARTAHTHPHYWVEVSLKLDVDNQGRLIAIEQQWQFDEFVSAILLEGMDTIVPGRPPTSVLESESHRIVKDLIPYRYYTHLSFKHSPANKKTIALPDPASHYLSVSQTDVSEKGKPRPPVNLLSLVMRFEFPQPVNITENTLEISVYDPTYYAAFNFSSTKPMTLPKMPNVECETQVALPTPDEAMVAYAFSLDQNQRDTGGLGQHFAEQLALSCQSSGVF